MTDNINIEIAEWVVKSLGYSVAKGESTEKAWGKRKRDEYAMDDSSDDSSEDYSGDEDDVNKSKSDDDSSECDTCGGTGKIMDGHRDCPDCNVNKDMAGHQFHGNQWTQGIGGGNKQDQPSASHTFQGNRWTSMVGRFSGRASADHGSGSALPTNPNDIPRGPMHGDAPKFQHADNRYNQAPPSVRSYGPDRYPDKPAPGSTLHGSPDGKPITGVDHGNQYHQGERDGHYHPPYGTPDVPHPDVRPDKGGATGGSPWHSNASEWHQSHPLAHWMDGSRAVEEG